MGEGANRIMRTMASRYQQEFDEMSRQLQWLEHKAQSGKEKDLKKLARWKERNLARYERAQKVLADLNKHYDEWGL